MTDDKLIEKRMLELSDRAFNNNYYTYTNFLGLAEQNILNGTGIRKVTLFGGCVGCERVVAAFGDVDMLGYKPEFPISCIMAKPLQARYADKLTHRDVLGSLMNLGITRETTGDIIITDNVCYIFCLNNIADFICDNLTRIKHTDVRCTITDKIPDIIDRAETITILAASARIDALISKTYKLSRNAALNLIKDNKVYINGVLCTGSNRQPAESDIISVRGFGRFRYDGTDGETHKGNKRVIITRW